MTGWNAGSMPGQRGRVAVVTGANSGLGQVTATELARHGAAESLTGVGYLGPGRSRERGPSGP